MLDLTPEGLLVRIIAVGLGMTIHEFAHNYIGWRMGDPEPKQAGRLTLNPFVHINWIGFLMFVLIGFGILGSAPISPFRMPRENRRWRWLAAVAAGPVSNLLLAAVVALIMRIIGWQALGDMPRIILSILAGIVSWNVLLFLFNLIPLFPIDGWQIIYALLPPTLAGEWEKQRSTTQFIFMGLLLLSFVNIPGIPNFFGILIAQPANSLVSFLLGV